MESSTSAENSNVDEGENSDFSDIDNEEDSDQDQEHMLEHDSFDHTPMRGTRSLADIYSRCNVTIVELVAYSEAAKCENWRHVMLEEINMIEKNETWPLIDRPNHNKVIGLK